MEIIMNSQRLSEFEEYFQINESIRVNLFAVSNEQVPKSQQALGLHRLSFEVDVTSFVQAHSLR